ncbi:MAG: efflux RND transporter periplasmic adaptor subunit [Microscillaceae bacterium]|jgi:RND family efflux transporter MFP subunit|nr:efflux RND transporter periplasmic adaptor subunit [Microscillaceae bacterium]
MKTNFKIIFLLVALFLTACGGSKDSVEAKKQQLRQKQKDLEQLQAEIKGLEKEIGKLDPSFAKSVSSAVLVTTAAVSSDKFTGYAEVQGSVKTDNNVILSAEASGIIRSLNVIEGQAVGAGQVLLAQDGEILQKNIAEVKSSLELAEITFKRQENLWNQKIGTELQYLQAKNAKEGLEKRLQTLYAQAKLGIVTAPFSGIVDEIFVKRGQAAMPGQQLLRLVSSSQVKVVAEVSEAYLGKVRRGDVITIAFPSLDKEVEAPVSLIGQTINPENRTFRVEAMLANPDNMLKPDLLAKIKLKNYEKSNALVVPTHLIQRDKAGEYVFVLAKDQAKTIAKKIRVKSGNTFKNRTEINEGLKVEDVLIDEGFREVLEGTEVKIIEQKKAITAK